MGWMELTASLVQSLAWPVAVVIAVIVLRKQLAGFLNRVGLVNFGKLQAFFDRELDEARQGLGQAAPGRDYSVSADIKGRGSLRADLEALADASPPASILEAFAQVEQALRQAMPDNPAASRLDGLQLAGLALNNAVINQETYRAIQGLSVLRNLAAHSPERDEIDSKRARKFAALADAVIYSIERGPGH
jgi:hypothetical protein